VNAIAAPTAHRTAVHATVAPVDVWSATTPAIQGPAVWPTANSVVNAAIVAVQSSGGVPSLTRTVTAAGTHMNVAP
jgi:hypothetical protein